MASEKEVGFVYVAQMEGHPLYKIGRSVDVPRRMSDFGLQLPFPVTLVFAHRFYNYCRIETNAHRAFEDRRVNGEWFRFEEGVGAVRSYLLTMQAQALSHRLVCVFFKRVADENAHLDGEFLLRFSKLFFMTARRVIRRTYLGTDRCLCLQCCTEGNTHNKSQVLNTDQVQ